MSRKKLSPQEKEARKLQRRARRKQERKALKSNGWKPFTGESLPKNACFHKSKYDTDPNGHNIFEYGGCWIEGFTYYKGDSPETATEWIITTDNAGFYKVHASYMIWHPNGSQALWSGAALKRSMKALLASGKTVADPDYQT